MIKLENLEIYGIRASIRGMRNPMDSWDKSDSQDIYSLSFGNKVEYYGVGEADRGLMQRLAQAGTDHRKFMRMITVYVDITAPLYWWKEFDTYKVGTVANSCSTMHTIHKHGISADLFSFDNEDRAIKTLSVNQVNILESYLNMLEELRQNCKSGDELWRKLIQLLPEGFNQKRTVLLNYEVLANIYKSRKNHKLKEWRDFCKWIETLPYSELITGRAE